MVASFLFERVVMKRFLLFCGATYYPNRAWHDFAGDYDTLIEALCGPYANEDWYQIVDTETMKVVKENEDISGLYSRGKL